MRLITSTFKFEAKNNLFYNLIYLVLILIYISFALHLPVSIIGSLVHDDAWYMVKAISLLSGDWMGTYNQMTLIKGIGYPIFIAINFLLGTPITLTTALLNLLSCFFLVYLLGKFGLPKYLALLLFAFLLFQPALFPLRILRDNFYSSLTVIIITGFIYTTLYKIEESKCILVVTSGLLFGLFWITREEGIWVLPSMILLASYSILINSNKIDRIKRVKLIVIYVFTALLLPLTNGLINQKFYGVFQTNDIKSKSFSGALNTLYGVDLGNEIQYLSVSKKKRELIYKISPTFKTLESFFEDPSNGWKNHGCAFYKETCGDFATGWFMWAIRDGVSSLGHYKSAKDAEKFYDKITYEINDGCKSGKITCSNNPFPLMPKLSQQAIESIPNKLKEALKVTFYKTPLQIISSPSAPYELSKYLSLLGYPRIIETEQEQVMSVSGWFYSKNKDWGNLICDTDQNSLITPISRKPSPDIALGFKDKTANNQRFSFSISNFQMCSIVFGNSKIKLSSIAMNGSKHFQTKLSDLHFDLIKLNDKTNDEIIKTDPFSAKQILTQIYKSVSIYIYVLGSIFFAIALVMSIKNKSTKDNLVIISIFLWLIYYSRVLLIVLIDVTSFPGITYAYLMPSFNIWFAASFMSLAAFVNIFKLKNNTNSVKINNSK